MKISVVNKENEYRFVAAEDERILYAGLRQGFDLPYECATGTCGSCKAGLKSGTIRALWTASPGAKFCKSGKNEFLMCQSVATGDCEIGLRAKVTAGDRGAAPDYYRGSLSEAELLTPDVMRFKVIFERPLPFRSGQFVVMSVEGLDGGRAYSMVNPNAAGAELEFIVKRLSGGGFSEWLFGRSRKGAPVNVFGPLGRATLANDEAKNLFCIAGGSGIAGIISLLGQAVESGYFETNHGHLFFGLRSARDVFFRDRLIALTEQSQQNLKITLTFSDGKIPSQLACAADNIEFLPGDVTPQAMRRIGANLTGTVVFLAGPPAMVDDAIRRLVIEAGFPVADIRYDKFG